MKPDFSVHIFEKYTNIKFYKNPSSGSRAVPCGRTDRQDESNSRFSQFCESSSKRRGKTRNKTLNEMASRQEEA